jgi:hypothetical protein
MRATASEERSQGQIMLFCLAWVVMHLVAVALLDLPLGSRGAVHPIGYAYWGTLMFAIQAPLLLSWLRAWKEAPAWLVGGALLF